MEHHYDNKKLILFLIFKKSWSTLGLQSTWTPSPMRSSTLDSRPFWPTLLPVKRLEKHVGPYPCQRSARCSQMTSKPKKAINRPIEREENSPLIHQRTILYAYKKRRPKRIVIMSTIASKVCMLNSSARESVGSRILGRMQESMPSLAYCRTSIEILRPKIRPTIGLQPIQFLSNVCRPS